MTELIAGLHHIKPRHHGCVATIGNFNGLHKGHQVIIQALISGAKDLNLPTCVIIFEPHPQEYFLGEQASARLMRLREKLTLSRSLSLEITLCRLVNQLVGASFATEFVKKTLVN